jgi:glycosyltransferase involved in cell wall biosynthesis
MEAMTMGKPTLATDHSGHTDFMTSSTSLLVQTDKMTATTGHDFDSSYQRWAEPSIVDLRRRMRQVVEMGGRERRRLGRRARRQIVTYYSHDAVTKVINQRLEYIKKNFIED